MNSESGKKLSMNELKRLNQPQMQEPPPERHPTVEEWEMLLRQIQHIAKQVSTMNNRLAQLLNKPMGGMTWSQGEEMLKQLRGLTQMAEQAGKPKEKRFSLPRLRLPHIKLSPALLLVPVILLVCWAMWSSWDTLWNAIRTLRP